MTSDIRLPQDLYTVKELLGHKTITMTMRYAHYNTESIRHAVEVLDKNGYDLVTFNKKGSARIAKPLILLATRAGFEPTTFG